jgi:peptidoglycan/LPS O-acetylase OafA/YrhL
MDASAVQFPFHLGYRRWLDGLRGWAILLVLAFHLGLLPGGSLGVDVFFVLSGFLITTVLAEEWQRRGSINFMHFYGRRALRLWPAFFGLLAGYGSYSWLCLAEAEAREHWQEILVAACYVANWPTLHQTGFAALGHTWSLSLEEQFYLLWPPLLWLMLVLRLRQKTILALVCVGILATVTVRITLYHLHRTPGPDKEANVMRMYMGLDTRADSLLVGCGVGLLTAWNRLPTSRRAIRWLNSGAAVSALALAYLAAFSAETRTLYFHGLLTVVALLVGIIIMRMLVAPSPIGRLLLEWAPLVGVGRISYGIYLYHIMVVYGLRQAGIDRSHPVGMAVIVVLSLAAALVSYVAIERPFLRLKDRLGQRRAARLSMVRDIIGPRAPMRRAA